MLLVVALCCALVAGLQASPISPQREIIPLNAEAFAQPEYVQALAKELEKEGTTTESSPRIRRNLDQIGGGNLLREKEQTATLDHNQPKADDFSSLRSKRGYPVHIYEPVLPTLFGITKLTTTTTTVAPKEHREYHYSGGNLDHIGGGNLLRKKL